MEIINILGIKKFMECIISQNINFNYNNNLMSFSHESYIDINDYKQTLIDLEYRFNGMESTNTEYNTLQTAIELLRDLIYKLENKI